MRIYSTLNILTIITHGIKGGAARAAYRLHNSLRDIGVELKMLAQRDTLLKLNKFDDNLKSAAHFDLVMSLCLSGAKFIEVPFNFVSSRLAGISYANQERSRNECANSCKNNLNKFSEHDIETYKKMYKNLLIPQKLYKSVVNNLNYEYKIKLTYQIENHSIKKGDYYKINKYPQLEEKPNPRDDNKWFLNFPLIFKKIIRKLYNLTA